MTGSRSREAAAGDEPAAPPAALSATAWQRWRAQNPPAYLQPWNRRDGRCGACGGVLGPVTLLCVACHRAELEQARRPQPTSPPVRVVPDSGRRRIQTDERVAVIDGEPVVRTWFVVVDAGGVEVTRDLRRDRAQLYLR